MEIDVWNLTQIGALAEFYSRQIEDIPHCYPLSPEDFGWQLGRNMGHLSGIRPEQLHSDQLIVARENGNIQGFVHVAIEERIRKEEVRKRGIIRFMGYEPSKRLVGEALLDEAESFFLSSDLDKASAFTKGYVYHFYTEDGGCSEHMAHVWALLGSRGYTISERVLNMAWHNFNVDEPVLPTPQATINVSKGSDVGALPNIMLSAEIDGREIGECLTYSLGHLHPTEEAQECLIINWLVAREMFRQQGWGKYLLLRALWEAQQEGYKHCLLGTDERNYRAQLLYTTCGYRIKHTSSVFVKDLVMQ